MAENAATEILDALMRNLKEILRTESIVGQPIQAGKATILPVIKVVVGFGAGGGAGTQDKPGGASNGARGLMGSGGGGGGGMVITPVGFLVIEEGRAMMVTPSSGRWDWLVEGIPEMWEKISKSRQEGKERKTGSASAKSGQSDS